METNTATTPFGRRPFSLAMVASQTLARECPRGIAVHKWKVFHAICEGRGLLGIPERALAVLNALLTFHPETTLTGGDELIVFPSNRQLALRAHGMAPATLRRHLAVLVEAGIVIRRDSPNGKRYARKDADGALEKAFGFDLSPFVARASEFERLASEVRAERRAVLDLRERITVARRDVSKMIGTGIEEGVPGDWTAYRELYASIVGRLPRTADSLTLRPIAQELELLASELRMLLETHVDSQKKNANESQTERHIQNSKTQPPSELEQDFQESLAERSIQPDKVPTQQQRTFPLGVILQACPDIIDYGRGGISSWRDLKTAAELVRGMLGISASAWEEAREAFGDDDAAAVVAAILQRGEAIKSAGGYIRDLTGKRRREALSIGPMIMALLRSHGSMRKRA